MLRPRRHSNPDNVEALAAYAISREEISNDRIGSGGLLAMLSSPKSNTKSPIARSPTPTSPPISPSHSMIDIFKAKDSKHSHLRKVGRPESCRIHFSTMLSQMLRDKQLIDVEIQVKTNKTAFDHRMDIFSEIERDGITYFKCHKLVLAAYSSYFNKMFTSGFKETAGNVISLEGVDSFGLRYILYYMYESVIHINIENIVELAMNADHLGVISLKEELCHEAFKTIHSDNACQIFSQADQGGLIDLKERVMFYILKNFGFINDTLVLELDAFANIIQSEELIVSNELVVFEACSKYISNQSVENQAIAANRLLPLIRFPLLGSQHLAKFVMGDAKMNHFPQLKELVLEAFTYLSLPASERKDISRGGRMKRRKGMGCDITQSKIVYTLEGHEGNIESVACIDEKYLATGSADGTIKIWNGLIRSCEKTLAQHIDDIRALVYVNDKLISGSLDGTIKVWETVNFTCERTLSGFGGTTCFSVFKKGSKTFLLAGNNFGHINSWNTKNWSNKKFEAHSFPISCICNNSSYLCSSSNDRSLKIWELSLASNNVWETVKIINNLEHTISSMVFCSEIYLATGISNGSIKIWSTPNLECLHNLSSHSSPVNRLIINGDFLVSGSSEDGEIVVWHTNSWLGDKVEHLSMKNGVVVLWGDGVVISSNTEIFCCI